MLGYIKLAVLGLAVIIAAVAAGLARDLSYQIHALIFMVSGSHRILLADPSCGRTRHRWSTRTPIWTGRCATA